MKLKQDFIFVIKLTLDVTVLYLRIIGGRYENREYQ